MIFGSFSNPVAFHARCKSPSTSSRRRIVLLTRSDFDGLVPLLMKVGQVIVDDAEKVITCQGALLRKSPRGRSPEGDPSLSGDGRAPRHAPGGSVYRFNRLSSASA